MKVVRGFKLFDLEGLIHEIFAEDNKAYENILKLGNVKIVKPISTHSFKYERGNSLFNSCFKYNPLPVDSIYSHEYNPETMCFNVKSVMYKDSADSYFSIIKNHVKQAFESDCELFNSRVKYVLPQTVNDNNILKKIIKSHDLKDFDYLPIRNNCRIPILFFNPDISKGEIYRNLGNYPVKSNHKKWASIKNPDFLRMLLIRGSYRLSFPEIFEKDLW